MPRVRLQVPKSVEDNGVEIGISKAIQAVRTGQGPSMRRAAEVYAVLYSTLRGRMVLGRKRKVEAHVKELKLSPAKEKSIVKWITSLDN